MKVSICIDYDNLLEIQKQRGVADLTRQLLINLPFAAGGSARGQCEVRIYGGWYEGPTMTPRSQVVASEVQRDFPMIVRTPNADGSVCALRVTAELALALLEEPNHHIVNTFRKKARPTNVRIASPGDAQCTLVECPLAFAKSLLKTGKCPTSGCRTSHTPLVSRSEQKIVDTMLTCDLLYLAAQDYDQLVLVSEDDDFLAPIRTILLRGKDIVRVHPKISAGRTTTQVGSRKLIEIGI